MLQLNRAHYTEAVACSQSKSPQPGWNLAGGWGGGPPVRGTSGRSLNELNLDVPLYIGGVT
jgi:hypothetical protein